MRVRFPTVGVGIGLLAFTCAMGAWADTVTDWNSVLLQSIKNESTAAPLAARNLAMVHAAMFDAVNAIERRFEFYLSAPDASSGASSVAAATGAAYATLAYLFPSEAALFDALLARSISDSQGDSGWDEGFALGQDVAITMLAWRGGDGASTTISYIPSFEPGDWQRTPPFFRPPDLPQWPYVVPFALTHGAQFRPAGPPALDTPEYAEDLNMTKQLGGVGSATRTPEQTLIAGFWSDFNYTVTPPGHWNQIAQNVITNRTHSLIESARLFALLNMALADAGIVAWDSKYAYNLWRPVTAIREADTDNNTETEFDPAWTSLLTNPPFPEYVSGHSTFSGAAAAVLGAFFGTDHLTFTVGSDTLGDVSRTYESFKDAADEIGLSRIYGGIHFLSANLDGLKAGDDVGRYVFNHVLTPLPRPDPAHLEITRSARPGLLNIHVTGSEGILYVLESSSDLAHWAPVLTNQTPFSHSQTLTEGKSVNFLRAVTWQ